MLITGDRSQEEMPKLKTCFSPQRRKERKETNNKRS
jgi:hypothetical protein